MMRTTTLKEFIQSYGLGGISVQVIDHKAEFSPDCTGIVYLPSEFEPAGMLVTVSSQDTGAGISLFFEGEER